MRNLLIDADILAFQIASSMEEVCEFNGVHVLWADANKGKAEVDNAIDYILETTDGDSYSLCLTHPYNFRKDVLETYKANRQDKRKPMILGALRKYMLERHGALMWHGLEGDDIIGIMATDPEHKDNGDDMVVFSIDKDMRTVPGLHWDPLDGQIIEVTQAEADYNFLYQTLVGDATDNFKGCPNVGPVKANKILSENPTWEAVVNTYLKAGLTEADALQQARCARILRHGDYDLEQQKVKLWTP